MKITTFNVQIVTKNAAPIVQFFEELGFERRHRQEGIGDLDVTGIRMRNADGFSLDISEVEGLPKESMVAIRMNVDDFDEAYKILSSYGFKSVYGKKEVRTRTGRSDMLFSPSGFAINLIQHIKEDK